MKKVIEMIRVIIGALVASFLLVAFFCVIGMALSFMSSHVWTLVVGGIIAFLLIMKEV